jgi:hypothetical protein
MAMGDGAGVLAFLCPNGIHIKLTLWEWGWGWGMGMGDGLWVQNVIYADLAWKSTFV